MQQLKRINLLFIWITSIVFFFACSDSSEPQPPPKPEVKLSVDKQSIQANGLDQVTFTVTVNGVASTSSVVITQKETSQPITGTIFSTNQAGTFTFYAVYEGQQSNSVSIQATESLLSLHVDKATIKANGKDMVTFTVKQDDRDITSSSSIILQSKNDSILQGHTFSSNSTGEFVFYAKYKDQITDTVTIHASALDVKLIVDKTSILANNSDHARFTVTADGEDITSLTDIFQKGKPDVKIQNAAFITDEASAYLFYAVYNGVKTNEVNVQATYVELAFLKGYAIFQITSTICPNCPLMRNAIQEVRSGLAGRVHNIALHPYGKYCNSALAGALSSVAIQFADNIKADPSSTPPLAIVEMYQPEYLSATTTPKRIENAIHQSTQARDRVSESGIAIQSHVENEMITFTAQIKSVATKNYRFFAFVIENGVVQSQRLNNGSTDKNYVHNDVATYLLKEGDPIQGIDLGVIHSGKSISKTFTINTKDFETKRDVNLSNCRIVAYTLREIGGTYRIDNVTSCPVNGSVPFLYEK